MENTDIKSSDKKKNPRGSDSFCKIIAAQFFACAFMVCLLAVVCRLGGAQELKSKYNQIMKNDMNISQVISSAKDVAESVMKPVSEPKTVEIVRDAPLEEAEKTEEK